jgi:hypothetical protein
MYSQAKQDQFIIHMMEGRIGNYLEIGASHPVYINNTYLLEQNGWTGLSIDNDQSNMGEWLKYRKNPLVIADALTFDYEEPDRIDYLQLDIEPTHQTFKCLQRMMLMDTRFSIITFETDAYLDDSFVEKSRNLIQSQGYTLAIPDVQCPFGAFEDWYIDEAVIDLRLLKTWKI